MKKILIGFRCPNNSCKYLLTKVQRGFALKNFLCPNCSKTKIEDFTEVWAGKEQNAN